jgi:cytochrome P450
LLPPASLNPLGPIMATRMTEDASIVEIPAPPDGRLSFPMLLARMVRNPIASWGRDFYEEPIIVYRSFGLDTVFVMDPALIQTVLLDDIDSFTKNPLYENVLGAGGGEGLLIAEGEKWRWQRRLAAPLFRGAEVAAHVPVFVASSARLLRRWRNDEPGAVQQIDLDIAATTLEALIDALLGADLGGEERQRVAAASTAFLKGTVWKIAYGSLKFPTWMPHPHMLRMARAALAVRDVAAAALARRRQSGVPGSDLLGRLMTAEDPASGKTMSDTLIVDNVVTYLLAGHETTAKALTWTLYVLALVPEWQERVRDEVMRITEGRPVVAEQIPQLELLERVFLEAMRLYPPAPSLMRLAKRQTSLGGTEIKQGATITIPIYVVHRHRKLWKEPLKFDPARFAPEAASGRHRCAYMPFSAGPRNCIGGTFAMFEAKAMLATLLAGARFELPPGEVPTPVARITLHARPGVGLKVFGL